MNWVTKNIAEAIADFLNGILDFFSQWIIDIFDKDIEIFSSTEIAGAVLVTKGIAIVLVILMTFKHIFSTYVMETDGDPDMDPMQLMVKASVALALIEGNDLIFTIFQTLSKKFSADIVNGSVDATKFTVNMDALTINLAASKITNQSTVVFVIMLLICIIVIIVLSFKAGLRAGELALMKMLFPIMAIDKLGTNPERWNAFFTSYVVTFFGWSFQLFCIRIGMNRMIFAMAEGLLTFINYFAALVLFWLAIKTPKWLEKFAYSSGLGQMAGNGLRTAGFMLPSFMLRR